jgi:integrase
MQDQVIANPAPHRRVPWNKGKLTGAKPPLRPKHVRSIRTKLQIEDRSRDHAMFNLAIDSKRRGCDVVAIRVEDVAAGGYTADRATVRQKKNGRPVRFELSEQTRQAIDDYLQAANKRPASSCSRGASRPGHSCRFDPAPINSGLPDQQTWTVLVGMSQTCQEATIQSDQQVRLTPNTDAAVWLALLISPYRSR